MRVLKFLHGVARISIVVASCLWISTGFSLGTALGALLVSGSWLAFTRLSSQYYLRSYVNVASRLGMLIPVAGGLTLSVLAVFTSQDWWQVGLAAVSFLAWSGMYTRYRGNRSSYKRVGHGPVPAGAAVSPDLKWIQEGDLFLSGGGAMDFAKITESAVGHAELVVRNPDTGELMCLSSYMRCGAVLGPIGRVHHIYRTRGHFLIARPVQPLSDRQRAALWLGAQIMIEQNARYVELKQQRRKARAARRPRCIQQVREVIWKQLPATIQVQLGVVVNSGYDLRALFNGRRSSDRWTCVGACTELYARIGVPIQSYGTGLLGLGTGFLDPILPVKFLYDPAMRVLTDSECGEAEKDRESRHRYPRLPGAVLVVADTVRLGGKFSGSILTHRRK